MATAATAYYVHPEEHVPSVAAEPFPAGWSARRSSRRIPSKLFLVTRSRCWTISSGQIGHLHRRKVGPHRVRRGRWSFVHRRRRPGKREGEVRALNANIVDPLVEDGYIEVNDVGRTKQVALTETGENVLQAFRHKL